MFGVVVWDFQRVRRQSTWIWKSKCLVDKCLLGHAETVGHREDLTDFVRLLPV